jgi:hypothetical protein
MRHDAYNLREIIFSAGKIYKKTDNLAGGVIEHKIVKNGDLL